MTSPLLKYAILTSPDPIQVGPQNGTPTDPSLATLTVVGSNPEGHAVSCKSIEFSFLKGTNARDFFSGSTGMGLSAPAGWSLTQSGSTFTAKPNTTQDGEIGADGVVFTISNIPVNTQPGTTPLTIIEETIDSAGSTRTGTKEIDLGKFPQEFEVQPLWTDELPPVDFGGSVTLNWIGTSGASYVLQYQDKHDQTITVTETDDGQPLPSSGSYRVDDLEKDTTFYLIVMLDVDGQDEPLEAERFITVSVNQPQPVINSFTYTATQTKLVLRWETSYAETCTITGDPHPVNTSSTDDSYYRTWPDPNVGDGIYTLTATTSIMDGGNTATWTIHTIPVINSFTASTIGPIEWNTPVTLHWDTSYAQTVTITPDVGQVSATGYVQVSPFNNITYTLTCTGFGPDVTAQPISIQVDPGITHISVTSANSVEVTIHALAGTYIVNWSVDWETGETAGTSTNSMTITSDGSPQTVVWDNVPMDMPPPYGMIVAARCTITPSNT
jgi:hypothetical protein